jgi:hypothetical protein
MNPVEFELNGAKLRVYPTGEVWRFGKKSWNSIDEKWIQIKGCKKITITGYIRHHTSINKKIYTTSRIIYKAFNLDWDIDNITLNNTIDHINRDSLDNHISNLRVANKKEQALNRDCIINAKGYFKHGNKFRVQICINYKNIHIGLFKTELEASLAYQNAVIKYRN